MDYDNQLFIIAGTYDKKVCIYLVKEELNTISQINNIEFEDKILNIQIYGENAYISLLNGCVYSAKLSDLSTGSSSVNKLFGSLSGLRCCQVDFSRSNLSWDTDFRKLIGYYGRGCQ